MAAIKKQSLTTYLERSGQFLEQAKQIAKDNPKRGCKLAAQQLFEHIKLLKKAQ